MTIINFILVIIFAIISALIAYLFSSLFNNGIAKIFISLLIGVCLFIFSIGLLIPCKKYENLRVWQIILNLFMFKSINQNFNMNVKNKSSLNLVPYNKTASNMLISEKEFIGAIKIKSYNLIQLPLSE